MDDRNNRRKVHQEMEKVMSRDRARTRMSREVSEFGLIEMTRQRIRPSLLYTFSESCPVCDGTGRIMSRITMVTQIGRWLKRAKPGLRERKLKLKVHPTVALSLNENAQEKLLNLQDEFKIQLQIEEDPFLHVEEFRVFSGKRDLDVTDEFK
jgi:ribonuclease G